MTHYICTGGCGGVSPKSGVCQAENCPLHKQSLRACECEDGTHAEAYEDATIIAPEQENPPDDQDELN